MNTVVHNPGRDHLPDVVPKKEDKGRACADALLKSSQPDELKSLIGRS